MSIEKTITDAFPESVLETKDIFGTPNLKIKSADLAAICGKLHSEMGFDYLEDVTAIDWRDRIEVVYHMRNIASNDKIALRVDLNREKPEIDTVTNIWKGADYQEREVFDLMGVIFIGHPDLRRILLPEDWEGYPLRKDYVIPD